ncbi:RNA recognition motif domain [Dillenia turbinata]|uniref:RNA recognition motif domain n=1 Tax=Dillenia turbinata TaxID=194707 RepID=A0AAN8UMC7_9MAGN
MLKESEMAEGTEHEERVDLDDDNYMEEIDDDVEEPAEDAVGIAGDENVEEHEDAKGRETEADPLPEADESNITSEPIKDGEKPAASVGEEDKQKHAELLALPPHGSEIFIGGVSRDTSEEELRDLCESMGEIFEIRIMKNKDTGESKGFAFISFMTKEAAQNAIEELTNKEFNGKTLRCSLSEAKNRLFIGNVPKNWTEDQFRKVVEEVGPGAENIELIKDPQNSSRNRGFAFIEYYNNACADYARQKMLAANFKLDDNTPTVTWADPKISADHSAAAAQVKALYVKNIPDSIDPERLKELFQRHGEVTKVVMPPSRTGNNKRDFGFIHYAERASALKAIKDTEKYEIDGQVLEVFLAKPQTEKKSDGAYPPNAGQYPSYYAHPGFGGFAGNPYGSMGAGYGVTAGYQQPMIYGRGPMPTGMQMVPMVLPDGRIGYVFQQPGVPIAPPLRPPRRNDRINGSGGQQGQASDDSNHV